MSKNLQNPSSPISRVLYPEHVYDDSSQDKPLVRWRTRNFYQDNPILDSLEDASLSPDRSESTGGFRKGQAENVVGLEDLITDPLDCILGNPNWIDSEPIQSNAGNIISRRKISAQKRRQRGRRTRHEQSSSLVGSPKTLSV